MTRREEGKFFTIDRRENINLFAGLIPSCWEIMRNFFVLLPRKQKTVNVEIHKIEITKPVVATLNQTGAHGNICLIIVRVIFRIDRSNKGHILGAPKRFTVTERDLSPAMVSLLRIILHSATITGAQEHPEVNYVQHGLRNLLILSQLF